MTRQIRSIATTFVASVIALSSAAVAQSYSGDWPATVTHSQRSNGNSCIQLTDDGNFGAPHSGEALLLPNQGQYPGYFTVVDGIITITFTYPSGEGDCCDYQVFTAHAGNGQIGDGVYNYFGLTDIGVLTFGKKNSCSN